jgi:hypothetical protein
MRKSRFKPGPYIVQESKSRHYYKIMHPREWHNGLTGKTEGHITLAAVYGTKDDASLLAAAPDLYDALESIINLASSPSTKGELVYLDYTEAREALARARGDK